MIIDKKQEEMLCRCQMRKRSIDKKLAIIRGFMLFPPIIYCAVVIIYVAISIIGETTILAMGAGLWGYEVRGSGVSNLFIIIECLWLIFLAASITVWRTEIIRKKKLTIYIATFIVGVIIQLASMNTMAIFAPLIAVGAVPFAYAHEPVASEDEAMSTLEGYPHFNPTLMRNTRMPGEKISQEEINAMTPDERIEFERNGYNHRNQY